jgi:hypothetical protein
MPRHPVPLEDSGAARAGSNTLPLILCSRHAVPAALFIDGAVMKGTYYEQDQEKDQTASLA